MPKFLNPERDTCECGAPRATWQSQCTACQVEADGIAPAVYFEPFRKLPPVGTPSVYAVTALHIPDCPIKFGFSTNARERLESLQTGSPVLLQFMVVAEAPQELERLIHLYLFSQRLHGEWFKRSPYTLQVVKMLLADRGQELLATIMDARRRINRLRAKYGRV